MRKNICDICQTEVPEDKLFNVRKEYIVNDVYDVCEKCKKKINKEIETLDTSFSNIKVFRVKNLIQEMKI